MSLAYSDEAVHIREVAPLTARDIARATGAGQSTRSRRGWRARARPAARAPSACSSSPRSSTRRPACCVPMRSRCG